MPKRTPLNYKSPAAPAPAAGGAAAAAGGAAAAAGGAAAAAAPANGPKYWVYAPYVPDVKQSKEKVIVDGAKVMISRIMTKHLVHPQLLMHTGDKARPLQQTKEGDVVYVTAHGNPSHVGTLGDGVSLTPEQLAHRLKDDGLNLKISKLKMSSCDSGTFVKNKGSHTETCFAQQLCKALYGLGFRHVKIYGYEGTLSIGDSTARHMRMIGDDKFQPASYQRAIFEDDGKKVTE